MATLSRHTPRTGWAIVGTLTGRLLLALAIPAALFSLIYSPAASRWGATDQEVARGMQGDTIQSHPILDATRAVTIDARPDQIWPWLVQIGYRRAGWYGYDSLDNAGIPSADRIIPELQQLHVGDTVPIWQGIDYKVRGIDADRDLVLAGTGGVDSMVLALYPTDPMHTRLVWRYRSIAWANLTSPWSSVLILFTEVADFIAVRQNMLGIKARAEGRATASLVILDAEVALWMLTFLAFLLAEVWLFLSRNWLIPSLAAAATGLITVAAVLSKPPVFVDGLVALGVWAALWWLRRNAVRFEPTKRAVV